MPITAQLLATTTPASAFAVTAFVKSGDWLVFADNVGTNLYRYHIPSDTLSITANWRPGPQTVTQAVVRSNGNVCFFRYSDFTGPQQRVLVHEVVPSTGATVNWQPPVLPGEPHIMFGSTEEIAVVNDVAFDSGYTTSGGGLLTSKLTALDLSARTAVRYYDPPGSIDMYSGTIYANGYVWVIPETDGQPFLRVDPSTLATTIPAISYNDPVWTDQEVGIQGIVVGDSIWWGTERPFGTATEDYHRLNTATLQFDRVPGMVGGDMYSGIARLDGSYAVFGFRGGSGGPRAVARLAVFPPTLTEPTYPTGAFDILSPRTFFYHPPRGDGQRRYGVGYAHNTSTLHLWRIDYGPDEPPPATGGVYFDAFAIGGGVMS